MGAILGSPSFRKLPCGALGLGFGTWGRELQGSRCRAYRVKVTSILNTLMDMKMEDETEGIVQGLYMVDIVHLA